VVECEGSKGYEVYIASHNVYYTTSATYVQKGFLCRYFILNTSIPIHFRSGGSLVYVMSAGICLCFSCVCSIVIHIVRHHRLHYYFTKDTSIDQSQEVFSLS